MKHPIAERARGHPEAGAGGPVEHKAEEREGARCPGYPEPRAGCGVRVAQAPSTRSGHGKFANSGLCGQRLAVPEVTALQPLPPGWGRRPPCPQPTAKCSNTGQVRRSQPAPLSGAPPAQGCRVLSRSFCSLAPADSLFLCLPL